MATSGSIDYGMNARDLIQFALKKIGVLDMLGTASGADATDAMVTVNLMLKSLQNEAPNLWRQTFGSVTPTAATVSYLLTPVPHRVHEVRWRFADGRDMPLNEFTRQEYVDLPLKTASGVPTCYYVDYQHGSVTLHLWPVPPAISTETVQYTYQRRYQDIDNINNDLDLPSEHLEAIGYRLASRLAESYGLNVPRIDARAAELFETLKAADREPFVRFMPERSW
jgi:hypothetical protein